MTLVPTLAKPCDLGLSPHSSAPPFPRPPACGAWGWFRAVTQLTSFALSCVRSPHRREWGEAGRSETALSVQMGTGRAGGDVERPRENGSWQETKPNSCEKIGLMTREEAAV